MVEYAPVEVAPRTERVIPLKVFRRPRRGSRVMSKIYHWNYRTKVVHKKIMGIFFLDLSKLLNSGEKLFPLNRIVSILVHLLHHHSYLIGLKTKV